jgi:transcriptional regulator with XRE-family HTH domain
MRYGERLKMARQRAGMTQLDLVKAIEYRCKQSNISKLERTAAAGSEWTVQFAKALGVDPHWLATGQGSPEKVKEPIELLPEPEQKLLVAFRGLTVEQQANAIRGLAALKAQNDALLQELLGRPKS